MRKRLPALVLLAASLSLSPAHAWTAFAVSDQGYAIVAGEGSANDAERSAKFDCPGTACRAISFEEGCVAVARSLDGGPVYVGQRYALSDALELAFDQCSDREPRCFIERSQCEYRR